MSLPFERIIDDLVNQRWCVIPEFIPATLTSVLYSEAKHRYNNNGMHAAKIGKGQNQQLNTDYRGDAILWLDGSTEPQKAYLSILDELKNQLNQNLYLGLNELEAHYALYPPGTFYKKHLDSFKNNNLRRITVLSYLNPSWCNEDGGELIIYNSQNEIITSVLPKAGTFVCFVSEELPHEVATTHAERASIAGWFRVRE